MLTRLRNSCHYIAWNPGLIVSHVLTFRLGLRFYLNIFLPCFPVTFGMCCSKVAMSSLNVLLGSEYVSSSQIKDSVQISRYCASLSIPITTQATSLYMYRLQNAPSIHYAESIAICAVEYLLENASEDVLPPVDFLNEHNQSCGIILVNQLLCYLHSFHCLKLFIENQWLENRELLAFC